MLKDAASDAEPYGGERLAKVIARSGLCSRRVAETWIESGRVKVNGSVVNTPALNVTISDAVEVDGAPLNAAEECRLWLFHKPAGVITSHKDPQKRQTVFDILPNSLPRVISIGRLDLNTEGLLLLTNDGAFARYLELPATGLKRSYRARVYGKADPAALDALKNGITLKDEDGTTIHYGPVLAVAESGVKDATAKNQWVHFTISEGKNREIRNICRHLDLRVSRLIRTSYGPSMLGDLNPGDVKELDRVTLRKHFSDFLNNQTVGKA
jgi:23S rRNA pseudouridine2605 synthase